MDNDKEEGLITTAQDAVVDTAKAGLEGGKGSGGDCHRGSCRGSPWLQQIDCTHLSQAVRQLFGALCDAAINELVSPT